MSREIVRDYCVLSDWESLGKPLPKKPEAYVLCMCSNCGTLIPTHRHNINNTRCAFCSGISGIGAKVNTNRWEIKGDIAMCYITNYKDPQFFIVDIDDFKSVSEHVWRLSKKRNKYYVITGSNKSKTDVYLHRFLVKDIPNGYVVDHINGNSLDNRRSNLRILTISENARSVKVKCTNKLGIRGINKCRGDYVASIQYNHRRYYFKHFKTIEEAVYCRKMAEEKAGLDILDKNPIAKKYLTWDSEREAQMRLYVDKIMGECKC